MIDFLKSIFTQQDEQPGQDNQQQMQLAAAVLLVEVAAIDNHFADDESETLLHILKDKFRLPADAVTQLKEQASEARANASSLHDHTRIVHENFSLQQKIELVGNMWQIAYADGELDKYEEYIIRRVSELIYVSHNDFIRAKQWARDRAFPAD